MLSENVQSPFIEQRKQDVIEEERGPETLPKSGSSKFAMIFSTVLGMIGLTMHFAFPVDDMGYSVLIYLGLITYGVLSALFDRKNLRKK